MNGEMKAGKTGTELQIQKQGYGYGRTKTSKNLLSASYRHQVEVQPNTRDCSENLQTLLLCSVSRGTCKQ